MKIIFSTSVFYQGKMCPPGSIMDVPDNVAKAFLNKKIASLYQKQGGNQPESSVPSGSPATNNNQQGAGHDLPRQNS